jgi:hypothetical protein
MGRVSHPDTTAGFNVVLYILILNILLTVLELKICYKGKGEVVPLVN